MNTCLGQDEVICPHCGYRKSEYWHHVDDSLKIVRPEIKCDDCKKKYYLTDVDITLKFSTRKEPEDENTRNN